jgi:geranylgeranyl diphosphate synthase type I
MLNKIKKSINAELAVFIQDLGSKYRLKAICPPLHDHIVNYINRPGKLIRPTLCALGYLAYAKKPAKRLYRSALSMELLHNFLLIHDDIIDKAALRRGKPSMHTMFAQYLEKMPEAKFSGSDLAIVAADIIYALSVDTFMAIRENPIRKENALKKFTEAAYLTGCGEFVEMLAGAKSIDSVRKKDIDAIYDLKTAHYTFASPLTIGALLAGAKPAQIELLTNYGMLVGRAFQIHDDLLDIFGTEQQIGKPPLTDVREAKKTLLVWYAYKHLPEKKKKLMQRIYDSGKPAMSDLLTVRSLITESGSADYAKRTIRSLVNSAARICGKLSVKPAYKEFLRRFPSTFISI